MADSNVDGVAAVGTGEAVEQVADAIAIHVQDGRRGRRIWVVDVDRVTAAGSIHRDDQTRRAPELNRGIGPIEIDRREACGRRVHDVDRVRDERADCVHAIRGVDDQTARRERVVDRLRSDERELLADRTVGRREIAARRKSTDAIGRRCGRKCASEVELIALRDHRRIGAEVEHEDPRDTAAVINRERVDLVAAPNNRRRRAGRTILDRDHVHSVAAVDVAFDVRSRHRHRAVFADRNRVIAVTAGDRATNRLSVPERDNVVARQSGDRAIQIGVDRKRIRRRTAREILDIGECPQSMSRQSARIGGTRTDREQVAVGVADDGVTARFPVDVLIEAARNFEGEGVAIGTASKREAQRHGSGHQECVAATVAGDEPINRRATLQDEAVVADARINRSDNAAANVDRVVQLTRRNVAPDSRHRRHQDRVVANQSGDVATEIRVDVEGVIAAAADQILDRVERRHLAQQRTAIRGGHVEEVAVVVARDDVVAATADDRACHAPEVIEEERVIALGAVQVFDLGEQRRLRRQRPATDDGKGSSPARSAKQIEQVVARISHQRVRSGTPVERAENAARVAKREEIVARLTGQTPHQNSLHVEGVIAQSADDVFHVGKIERVGINRVDRHSVGFADQLASVRLSDVEDVPVTVADDRVHAADTIDGTVQNAGISKREGVRSRAADQRLNIVVPTAQNRGGAILKGTGIDTVNREVLAQPSVVAHDRIRCQCRTWRTRPTVDIPAESAQIDEAEGVEIGAADERLEASNTDPVGGIAVGQDRSGASVRVTALIRAIHDPLRSHIQADERVASRASANHTINAGEALGNHCLGTEKSGHRITGEIDRPREPVIAIVERIRTDAAGETTRQDRGRVLKLQSIIASNSGDAMRLSPRHLKDVIQSTAGQNLEGRKS